MLLRKHLACLLHGLQLNLSAMSSSGLQKIAMLENLSVDIQTIHLCLGLSLLVSDMNTLANTHAIRHSHLVKQTRIRIHSHQRTHIFTCALANTQTRTHALSTHAFTIRTHTHTLSHFLINFHPLILSLRSNQICYADINSMHLDNSMFTLAAGHTHLCRLER